MRSAFSPCDGQWHIGWPGRVARHDLVYLSPPEDPLQGLPLGNGDVGVLAWTEGSRLILVFNKCDLWDDGPGVAPLRNWAPEQEDYSPALRHAGRLIIDTGLPIWDVFYLSAFQGRLSLADATLHLEANGPLGAIAVQAFVNHDDGLFCADVACDLPEPVAVTLTLERYGSRTFGHWYAQINRDPSIGLGGGDALVIPRGACLIQAVTEGTFALACRVINSETGQPTCERAHAHACTIRLPRSARQHFSLMAAVTSPLQRNAPEQAQALLDRGEATGIPVLYKAHSAAWKAFWLRSLMDSGQDYLDNLWHLTMYYACASQRGRYPGRFIQGLWAFNRDVQHWTFYFHWNQQQVYWPLNAAGHHDLVQSYLEYRFHGLAHARRDAREQFGVDGAFVSDVTDRHGRNSLSEGLNHTPVAQIALDFWRQYQYTGDSTFLRERALPYLLEAARFFESLFTREADGLYHACEGTGYEGWIRLRDAITELACARALFAATLRALRQAGVDEARAERWRDILEHLAPLPTVTPNACLTVQHDQVVLRRGYFKGRTVPCHQTYAAGWGIAEQGMLSSKIASDDLPQPPSDAYTVLHRLEKNETVYSSLREDMKVYDGIFPCAEYAPVFPAGIVGLAQRGCEAYNLAVTTAMLYAPDCMGWDPLPIVLARLGLRDELAEILRHWPARWQFYCNGFGHYGPRDMQKAEAALRFRTNRVRDAANPRSPSFPFGMWPFRHMGMESMAVLACAMNEALLQSYDGVLRVAPAAPTTGQARFTLHAIGGFVVSAEIIAGQVQWIAVRSTRGGECALENPWEICYIIRNGQAAGSDGERIVHLNTTPGELILVTDRPRALADWVVEPLDYPANEGPKACPEGWAQLGLPRMF